MKKDSLRDEIKLDYNEMLERMPVTKIIVKDLMKGTYREGQAKFVNWKPKPIIVPEQKKIPGKKIIAMIFIVLIGIGSTAILLKIIRKEFFADNYLAEQPVLPVQPQQFYSPPLPIQRPSVPATISATKNRKQYSYSGKEKIYTWIEEGIRHYTNLQDVAESKNAVELK